MKTVSNKPGAVHAPIRPRKLRNHCSGSAPHAQGLGFRKDHLIRTTPTRLTARTFG